MGVDCRPGLANVRDVGGLPTDGGGRVRSGVLFRSDAPLPDDPDPGLTPWPPAIVVDLRSPDEVPASHPLAGPGTTVVAVPLIAAANPVRMIAKRRFVRLDRLYEDMVRTRAADLARIADLVAGAQGPVLLHCAAGKDRTGVAVALLLAAVGVPRSEIERDYRRTESNIEAVVERMVAARPEPERENFRAMIGGVARDITGTPLSAIGVVLDRFAAHPGGAGGWLLDAGLPPASLDALRLRLTG